MRYLMCDRVLELEIGERIVGLKNVTLSEDYFTDHFPIYPVMPGALIIEAVAQLSEILVHRTVQKQAGRQVHGAMAMVEGAKFRHFVRPGDQLIIESRVESFRDEAVKFRARVTVGDKTVATMTLVLTCVEAEELIDPILERRMATTREFLDDPDYADRALGRG